MSITCSDNLPILADGVLYTEEMDLFDIEGNRKKAQVIAKVVSLKYFEETTTWVNDIEFTTPSGWYFVKKNDEPLFGQSLLRFYSSEESAEIARNAARQREIIKQMGALQMELQRLQQGNLTCK